MLLPILLPVSILIVPLADLVMAVVRRTRRGQAFYQPDKEHLHHRLLEIGHSQRRAVLVMWLWAGLIAFGGVLISLYSGRLTWAVLAAGFLTTVVLTFILPRVQRPGSPERRTIWSADGPGLPPPTDFVLFFTRPPHDDDPTRPPMMTTPTSSTRDSSTGSAVGGGFLAPERCGSFARSGSGTAAVNDQRARAFGSPATPHAGLEGSGPATWSMRTPRTTCGAATSLAWVGSSSLRSSVEWSSASSLTTRQEPPPGFSSVSPWALRQAPLPSGSASVRLCGTEGLR